MALPLAVPLIIAAAGAATNAVGAGVNSYQTARAFEDYDSSLGKVRGALLTDKYENPYENPGNKALLSGMRRELDRNAETINNQAASGGATFENTLAAKKANNEAMADVYSELIQAQEAKTAQINQQLLSLDMNRASSKLAAKQASGQNWMNLGSSLGSSLTNLGGTLLK